LPTGLRFFFLLFLLIQFTFFTVSFFLKVLGLFLLPLKLSLCFLLFSFDLRTAASASCSPGIARQKDTAIFFPARRRCRREEAMYCFPSILSFQSTNRFFLLFYRDPPVFNSMQAYTPNEGINQDSRFRFMLCPNLTDLDTRCIHSTTRLKSKIVHHTCLINSDYVIIT